MDPSVTQIINDAATKNGVDPVILGQIAQVESSGNPAAGNDASSAKGLFQFTGPTWKQYGNGADPLDPAANADAGARFLKDNSAALTGAGYEPTPGNIYLSHFAGAGGARKVLGADPTAPVSTVLSPDAIVANPFLKTMTVADLRAWADRKMGAGGPAAPQPAAQPAVQTSAGILNRAPGSAPSGALGLLNSGEPADDSDVLAQALARATPAEQPQVTALPGIRFVAPRGYDRARFLAALTNRQRIA